MIDLYKQSEHHKSSLKNYAPVHIAALVFLLIMGVSSFYPEANVRVGFANTEETLAENDQVAGDVGDQILSASRVDRGFAEPVLISDDIRLDETQLPLDTLFWADEDDSTVIETILNTMTDEQMLSQVFLIGWESEDASGPIMDWIRQRGLGGVKIFGWNGNNVGRLAEALSTMQASALGGPFGIPLFTATDQEGGWVRHIKDVTSITPGNMAIGASALPMDSYLSGYFIGQQLRAIGVNMNFAPTVDVYVNSQAHVIGPRAFSSDPLQSALLGLSFFQGMQQAAVIATAKHFPGHGNALGDSHGYMPVIEDDFDTVWQRDLLPYRMMIPEGLPAILSGHLNFPNITGDDKPASLSPYFKQEILHERLKFEGIVVTDDLYMGGAVNYGDRQGWSMDTIVLEALKAGNDMIMLSDTPALNDRIWTTSLTEMQENPEFHARVREAVSRILRVKLRFLKPEWRVPLTTDPNQVYEDISEFSGQPFFQEQAARGVTLIRDLGIPFIPHEDERVLLAGQDRDFLRQGQIAYPGAATYFFSYTPFYDADPQVISTLHRLAGNYDKVIVNLANPNSLEVIKGLEEYGDKIIVFSSLTPVYLEDLPWVNSAIAVYGWGEESFEAGFAALKGAIPFRGSLPVLLHPSDDPIQGSSSNQ